PLCARLDISRHAPRLHSFPTRRSSDLAITAIVLGLTVFGSWTVPGMAFIFGMITTALIYALARPGRQAGTVQLLLVGIAITAIRSEEHTSELQSRFDLVCRLLLEKKKT